MKIEIQDMETGEITVEEIPDDHPMAKALRWLDERNAEDAQASEDQP